MIIKYYSGNNIIIFEYLLGYKFFIDYFKILL